MSELSDEEKKVIELTKTIIEFAGDSYIPKENRKALQVLLNLIERQQKEIEELKNADLTIVYMDGFYDGQNKIKDKIKAILKKYGKKEIEYAPDFYKEIQSLLEEDKK